MERETKACWI